MRGGWGARQWLQVWGGTSNTSDHGFEHGGGFVGVVEIHALQIPHQAHVLCAQDVMIRLIVLIQAQWGMICRTALLRQEVLIEWRNVIVVVWVDRSFFACFETHAQLVQLTCIAMLFAATTDTGLNPSVLHLWLSGVWVDDTCGANDFSLLVIRIQADFHGGVWGCCSDVFGCGDRLGDVVTVRAEVVLAVLDGLHGVQCGVFCGQGVGGGVRNVLRSGSICCCHGGMAWGGWARCGDPRVVVIGVHRISVLGLEPRGGGGVGWDHLQTILRRTGLLLAAEL